MTHPVASIVYNWIESNSPNVCFPTHWRGSTPFRCLQLIPSNYRRPRLPRPNRPAICRPRMSDPPRMSSFSMAIAVFARARLRSCRGGIAKTVWPIFRCMIRGSRAVSDLPHDALMEQMVIIDHTGRRHWGPHAVRFLTHRLRRLWWLMPIAFFPGSMILWQPLYRWIARNRYRFGKTDPCDDGTCDLHRQRLDHFSRPQSKIPDGVRSFSIRGPIAVLQPAHPPFQDRWTSNARAREICACAHYGIAQRTPYSTLQS